MGRKHKIVNKSGIPQYAIDRFARCVFDDMREDFMKPEVQADFQRWLAERELNKKKKAAATQVATASFLSGSYGQTVTVVCLLISAEINK